MEDLREIFININYHSLYMSDDGGKNMFPYPSISIHFKFFQSVRQGGLSDS